jgi:hypothetical protein
MSTCSARSFSGATRSLTAGIARSFAASWVIATRYGDLTERCKTEKQMRAHVAALNEHRRSRTAPLTTEEKRVKVDAALKSIRSGATAPSPRSVGSPTDIDKIKVERIGITTDFIRQHRLPWIKGLSTSNPNTPNLEDKKHPNHSDRDVQEYLKKFGARKVEASALVRVPAAAEALCREAVLRYVNSRRILAFKVAEAERQEEVERAIRRMLRQQWAGKRK